MRDDAGGGKAKQRQPSGTSCMCNAAGKPREKNIRCASKSRQWALSEEAAAGSQQITQSYSCNPNTASQPLHILSWFFLNFISEVSGTGRNRQARAVFVVGFFVPNYHRYGYLHQNPTSVSCLSCFLLLQLLRGSRTLLPSFLVKFTYIFWDTRSLRVERDTGSNRSRNLYFSWSLHISNKNIH